MLYQQPTMPLKGRHTVMDSITLQMIVTVSSIIAANAVTLKWLRADLAKHAEVVENHRLNIRDLYKGMNDMMTKQEIAELVTQSNNYVKEDLEAHKVTMTVMSDNVVNMTVPLARMDERMKNRRGGEHD